MGRVIGPVCRWGRGRPGSKLGGESGAHHGLNIRAPYLQHTSTKQNISHALVQIGFRLKKEGKRADIVSERPKGLRRSSTLSLGITNYPPENPAKSHSPSGSKSESMGPLCILNTYTSGWPALASPN